MLLFEGFALLEKQLIKRICPPRKTIEPDFGLRIRWKFSSVYGRQGKKCLICLRLYQTLPSHLPSSSFYSSLAVATSCILKNMLLQLHLVSSYLRASLSLQPGIPAGTHCHSDLCINLEV